jgi:hypothetical protein
MENVGGLPGLVALVASTATLVSAFESYTNAPLHWRLLAAAIACACALWTLSGKLASWVNPPAATSVMGKAPGWSLPRYLLSALVLFAVAGCFLLFSTFLLIDRLTFELLETNGTTRSNALLIAPYVKVKRVTVQLPSYNDGKCEAHDNPHARLLMIDWNSPNPLLQIDEFEYPQRVRIDCNLPSAIVSVTADPTSTAIYSADDLWRWRILSFSAGGILWFIAMLRLSLLSR